MTTRIKEYHRPIPPTYWFSRKPYTLFILRELSSAALGAYAVFLIVLLAKAKDEAAFNALLEGLKSPLSIALHLVALAFAVYHSMTFFNLTPRVLVVPRGEERVPDVMIQGAHYAAWLVVSLVLFVLAIKA
jgi:fumarate reductase subunit C